MGKFKRAEAQSTSTLYSGRNLSTIAERTLVDAVSGSTTTIISAITIFSSLPYSISAQLTIRVFRRKGLYYFVLFP